MRFLRSTGSRRIVGREVEIRRRVWGRRRPADRDTIVEGGRSTAWLQVCWVDLARWVDDPLAHAWIRIPPRDSGSSEPSLPELIRCRPAGRAPDPPAWWAVVLHA